MIDSITVTMVCDGQNHVYLKTFYIDDLGEKYLMTEMRRGGWSISELGGDLCPECTLESN